MANPQTENGFIMVATEIWKALCRIRIPGEARQVLDVVIRKTYGFKKKTDVISVSQIMKASGLQRGHVVRARSKLLAMNMIRISRRSQKGTGDELTYSFNKDYETWRGVPKKVRGTIGVPKKVARRSNMGTTIDTLTKDKEKILFDEVIEHPSQSNTNKKITMRTLSDHFLKKYLEYQTSLVGEGAVRYDWKETIDGPVFARLWKHYKAENMFKLIDRFFASSDPWLEGKPRSIGIMSSMSNQLMSG